MKRMMVMGVVGALMAGCFTPRSSRKIDDLVPLVSPPEKVAHYAKNVVWTTVEGVQLKADVSWPDGRGPFPVLVWIHGGGWEQFSKEANVGLACYITNHGYTVVNMDYRMSPEVTMKTIIEDAMGAVIWAKDHAEEYGGDPARVAVAGHSAGGHLAAMIATACGDSYFRPAYQSRKGNDCKVQAAIPVSGVYDFGPHLEKDGPERWAEIFGAPPQADPRLYQKCSPVTYLRPDLPPQLVMWGEKDFLRQDNETWVKQLNAVGAPVESYMQPGVDHLWPTWHWTRPAKQTYDRMIEFLDQKLKSW